MQISRLSYLIVAASLGLGSMHALAQNTTTYTGNGAGSFGGPIGQGSLTLSTNGTTLNGTLQIGGNIAFNDEFVIYIDAQAGGFTSTSTLTDTGTPAGSDTLRGAVSGLSNGANGNAVVRAPLNFASGFAADYAIALSPAKAQFGSFYTLTSATNFTYGSNGNNGTANLTPTNSNNGTNGNGLFTFSIPLSLLGSPSSFTFQDTYLNGNDAYRSNETIGNSIVDNTNPTNTGSIAMDTATLTGVNTFVVPEPGTWATLSLAGGLLLGGAYLKRLRRQTSLS